MATIDTSGIDITKPESGEATTQSVRDNFSATKTQLDKLGPTETIQFGKVEVGDPGLETSGIDINGTTYTSTLRVNDIGGSTPAEVVFHRHSTTLHPLLIGARANSDTSTHSAVTAGQSLFSTYAAGYTGTHYDLFGESRFSVGTGTVSSTSAPGKWTLLLSADGAQTPSAVITADSDKSVVIAGALTSAAGTFTTLKATTPCLPDGYITGLIGSQDTDTDHDISISTGAARDSTGAYDLRLSSAMVKQIDAVWAVGTNQGGLDTGSVAADTEYWYFLIRKDSDASIDVLISASYSSPTMPAGYTYRSKPIHWVLTDGSANIIAHEAMESGCGVEYQWSSPAFDIDLSNTLTTTARTDAISVPTGIKVKASMNALIADSAASALAYISDPDATDLAPSASASPMSTLSSTTAKSGISIISVFTNTSGQIRARASIATVDTYRIATLGFQWSRK